jgi:predicted nucleotidyltransferase
MKVQELKALSKTLADWSQDRRITLFVYGSRARGDNRPDSDVDVHVKWVQPDASTTRWWTDENAEEFATINAKLPGRLEILERNDPLAAAIVATEVLHRDRNVICVRLPSKLGQK